MPHDLRELISLAKVTHKKSLWKVPEDANRVLNALRNDSMNFIPTDVYTVCNRLPKFKNANPNIWPPSRRAHESH